MAGVEVGTAYVTVLPSAKGFAGKLQSELGGTMSAAGSKAGDAAGKGFGSRFTSGVKLASVAGAAALAGIAAGGIAFAKGAIAEARESQKVGATTTAIIKATGGAAKISAAQIGDLAGAISAKTGVDDEVIQSGANMLLTFKNVRNEAGKGADVFNRATQAAADLSAAGFGDMAGQSKMLGKALNDPIKGISALSRSGVTFTDQQKKQIKTLVESGKTLDAQKIILKEIEAQVGGTAAASATAGEKMSVAWGNFKENIGTALLPTLDRLQGFISGRLLPGIQGVIDILFKGDFTKGFAEALNVSEDSKIVDVLFRVREGFKEVIRGVRAFGAAWRYNDGEVTSSGLPGFMERLGYAARQVYERVKQFITEFRNGEGAGGKFRDILEKIVDVAQSVAKWIGENATFVKQLAVAVLAGVAAFKIITTVVKVYTAVQAALNVVLSLNPIGLVIIAIAALVAGLVLAYQRSETFRRIVKGAFDAIGTAARFMWNNVVAPVIRFLLNGFDKVTGYYSTLLRALSHVPGFGWAKSAADALDRAGGKARELAQNIKDIPAQKTVNIDIYARSRTTGRVNVGGKDVNVGMRAHGGTVQAGQPYIVGERRPELFVPSERGRIEPRVAGGGKTELSESSLQRLAALMAATPVQATVSAGSFDRAMGAGR